MVLARGMLTTVITLSCDSYELEFYSSRFNLAKEDDDIWTFDGEFNVVDDLTVLSDKVGDLVNVDIEPIGGASLYRPGHYGSAVIEEVVADTRLSDLIVRLAFTGEPVRKTS